MISVSEKAKSKILQIQKEDAKESAYLKVSVKSGGCSGLMYDMAFVGNTGENDQSFEHNGIKLIVDKKSLLYLAGMTLDFSDGLNGKGFQFINPNATRTCGCGESFAM